MRKHGLGAEKPGGVGTILAEQVQIVLRKQNGEKQHPQMGLSFNLYKEERNLIEDFVSTQASA